MSFQTLYYGSLFLLLSKNFSDAKKSIEELNEAYPNYLDVNFFILIQF